MIDPKRKIGGERTVDIREEILKNIHAKRVTASILSDCDGVIAGSYLVRNESEKAGLSLQFVVEDGCLVDKGDEVLRISGSPKQILAAEEVFIGLLAKPSGIATNARKFVNAAGWRLKVVSGAWKKMPGALKDVIRNAISLGGASPRMVTGQFVYLEKNCIELLGGIKRSLGAVAHLENHKKVLQIKGRYGDIASEACEAADSGADIVFVDTGETHDMASVARKLVQTGLRNRVQLAFGGGVDLEVIRTLKTLDVDIVDVGRQIVDAPLLDMRLEIVALESGCEVLRSAGI
jgi:nicotinate-nucleotide pyrophosphorylase (carboxylating)